jgi:signal transduction histidine kinase
VTVAYGSDELAVSVDNNGRPLNDGASSGGSGITGMAERARALSGELSARRQPGGGFTVRATLPIERESDGAS